MSTETKDLTKVLSTGHVQGPVSPDEKGLDSVLLHEHKCRNCEVIFQCALPLCSGSWCDPELCADCDEALRGIWFPL